MKLPKNYKTKWIKAIDKCLAQKSYGSTFSCTLCSTTDKVYTVNPICSNCICSKYEDYEGISLDDNYPCVRVLTYRYGYTHNSFWSTRQCRNTLRKMKRWLEEQ